MRPLKITVVSHPDAAIFRLQGNLTLGDNAEVLRREFNDALEAGTTRFVFNLLEVPVADSGGLGQIAACYRRVEETGGLIKVVAGERIQHLLRAMRWTDLFVVVHTTERDALADLAD